MEEGRGKGEKKRPPGARARGASLSLNLLPPRSPSRPSPTVFVRVRPAHAGDGRYFVAVPRGTNASRYNPSHHHGDAMPAGAGGGFLAPGGLPPDAAAFTAYLRAIDAGFTGEYAAWAAEHGPPALAPAPPSPPREATEAPIPRSGAGAGEVEATIANASPSASGRSTQLAPSPAGGAPGAPAFSGVEALLSALEGMGVGNARIEVEPGAAAAGVVVRSTARDDDTARSELEMPALDGSALGWAVEVARAGVVPAPPRPDAAGGAPPPKTVPAGSRALTLTGPDGAFASYIPAPRPSLSVGVGAPPDVPAIGRQWQAWAPSTECGHYRWALAPARDWVVSARTLVALHATGAAYKAGTVGTTLVAAGAAWMEPGKVRFPGDEPARHEAAKAVGDLSLLATGGGLGLPLGHFVAWNASPALRLDLVRALAAEATAVEVMAAARAALEGGGGAGGEE